MSTWIFDTPKSRKRLDKLTGEDFVMTEMARGRERRERLKNARFIWPQKYHKVSYSHK